MKFTIAALFALLAMPVFADSLVGTWTLSIDSPRGIQNPQLVVEQSGDSLTGTYHSRRGPVAIETIEFDGSNFAFPLVIEVPIGEIEVLYRGRISGDEMQGVVQNPRGQVPFSGSRN